MNHQLWPLMIITSTLRPVLWWDRLISSVPPSTGDWSLAFVFTQCWKGKPYPPSMCSPCWIPSLRSTWAVRRSLCWRASARGPWHRTRGHRVAELCGRIMWLKWNYTVVLSTRCMTLKSEVQLTFPPQSAVSPGLCEASGLPNYTDREKVWYVS